MHATTTMEWVSILEWLILYKTVSGQIFKKLQCLCKGAIVNGYDMALGI